MRRMKWEIIFNLYFYYTLTNSLENNVLNKNKDFKFWYSQLSRRGILTSKILFSIFLLEHILNTMIKRNPIGRTQSYGNKREAYIPNGQANETIQKVLDTLILKEWDSWKVWFLQNPYFQWVYQNTLYLIRQNTNFNWPS